MEIGPFLTGRLLLLGVSYPGPVSQYGEIPYMNCAYELGLRPAGTIYLTKQDSTDVQSVL